jgi:hypothetical protein
MPGTWQPALGKLDPSRFRKKAPQVDLSALKPEIQLPAFVHLEKIDPQQRKDWYDNRPFFVLYLTIDTSRPADYSGRVQLRFADREASLPIRLTVTNSQPGTARVLIVETPYSSDTTEHGSDLDAATKVLTSLSTRVDCVHELPNQLEVYDTILLAAGPLAILKDEEASRLRAFVTNGGRLVIACDAFFGGTVPNANRIVADFGLQVVNRDYAQTVTITNIVPDGFTSGVRRLDFWRPALIRVTDPAQARILALAPSLDGGFVADARLGDRGHVFLLAQSLWWYRLDTGKAPSDNARLLHNLLAPEGH